VRCSMRGAWSGHAAGVGAKMRACVAAGSGGVRVGGVGRAQQRGEVGERGHVAAEGQARDEHGGHLRGQGFAR
jgi:hypothetical protein